MLRFGPGAILLLLLACFVSFAAEQHWAFQPVRAVQVPHAGPTARNQIDAFVQSKLNGLTPAQEADPVTLVRRVYLIALGSPPAPEEVSAFKNKFEKLVDHVLASPQFGERWARHWLDVVRFAETHGFEMNQPRPNAWRYRDYVIRGFNEDKPYDRFIREQLAGDALGEDAATGFIVGGPWDQVKSADAVLTANQRADELHDMVSTTSSAFLGLTVGCARCHDHKFDPIPQPDYYAIKACFADVQHGERRLRTADDDARAAQADNLRARLSEIDARWAEAEPLNARLNVEQFVPIAAKKVRFTIRNTTSLEPCIDELEIWTADSRNVALARSGAIARASSVYPNSDIHRLEHINDGKYGNSWSWISAETTQGWIEIELPRVETITKILWGRDREEKYKDRLAVDYEITGDGIVIASSSNREPYKANAALKPFPGERKKLQDQIAQLTGASMAYAGTFTKPEPIHRLHRGDPTLKREIVEPGVLSKIFPVGDDVRSLTSNRLALANWIANPRNPLTARVIVNRLWHSYFGQGIVTTPSDFGINGGRPSHPELLDWLAAELVSHNWSLKHIHRLILTSHTFRQSSAANERALAVDAANTLLWRFAPRRLEAEVIRDSILVVSGAVDLRQGGPGWSPFEPNDNYVRIYTPKEEFGPAEWRRMIYATSVRQRPDGVFGVFDCPDGGQIAPKRTSSTTPLQALNLLNSRFIMQQAELFAHRLNSESGRGLPDSRTLPRASSSTKSEGLGLRQSSAAFGHEAPIIKRAFQFAFNRPPTPSELAAAEQFISEQGLVLFCRALFNANEFVYVF